MSRFAAVPVAAANCYWCVTVARPPLLWVTDILQRLRLQGPFSASNETPTITLPHGRCSERSEPDRRRRQTRHDTAGGQQAVETAGGGVGLPHLHPSWSRLHQDDATRGTHCRARAARST